MFLFLLFANNAFAHGLATTKSQIVGNYLIEFEYNTVGNIASGEYQNYNFDILDAKTQKFVDFDRAFAKFSKKDGDVVAVGDLSASETLGPGMKSSRFGLVFADPGVYNLDLIFYDKNSNQLAESNFDFTVDPGTNQTSKLTQGGQSVILEIVLLIGGFILGYAINKFRKK